MTSSHLRAGAIFESPSCKLHFWAYEINRAKLLYRLYTHPGAFKLIADGSILAPRPTAAPSKAPHAGVKADEFTSLILS
jgi:hypothetical protein